MAGTQGHMDLGTASTRPLTKQFGWKMNQRMPRVREPGGRAFESTNLYAFKRVAICAAMAGTSSYTTHEEHCRPYQR